MENKKKFFFRNVFKQFPEGEINEYLHKNVFDTSDFKLHVQQVAFNLKVDESIVRDVLVSYFTNVFHVINIPRKIVTKINVYAYFSLTIQKGNRI